MAYQAPADPTGVMGKRIFAFIIDLAIGMIISGAVFFSLADAYENAPNGACDLVELETSVASCFQSGDMVYVLEDGDNAPLAGVSLAYGFGVFGLLQGLTGASIGKHMLGLRVVKQDGTLAGVGKCTVRWLLLIVDVFFCFLVGLITSLTSKNHRRVGDMAAGTFVIGKQWVGTPIGSGPMPPGYGQPPGYGPPPGYGAPPGYGPPPGQPPVQGGWAPPPTQPPPTQPPAQGGWTPPPTQPPPAGPPASPPPGEAGWGAPPPPENQ